MTNPEMAVDYVEACTVFCPTCYAAVGAKCVGWVRKCAHAGCQYVACHRREELPEPHMARAVEARLVPRSRDEAQS